MVILIVNNQTKNTKGVILRTPYGFCPICKAPGISRERRLDGNDRCSNGHIYKSRAALKSIEEEQPKQTEEGKSMTPDVYQKLAQRTECNQRNSLMRMTDSFIDAEDVDPNQEPQHTMLAQVRLNHSIIGLAGETGELASLLQKWIYYGKEFKEKEDCEEGAVKEELKTKLIEEYGDILWYVAEGLNTLGVSMEYVMRANIAKLKIRYPDKYTDFHAEETNRDLVKEEEAIKPYMPPDMDYEVE